jgi:hypothetical protein
VESAGPRTSVIAAWPIPVAMHVVVLAPPVQCCAGPVQSDPMDEEGPLGYRGPRSVVRLQDSDQPAVRRRASGLANTPVLLPLAAVCAYAIVLARATHVFIERTVTLNSDAASPMVLAGALGDPSQGTIHLANIAPYSTLLVDWMTRGLADHRALWLAWPYASYLAAVGLLGWTVHRVAGTWAAVLASIVALAATPSILHPLTAQGFHEPSLVTCIALMALLVSLADRRRRSSPRLLPAASVLVGAFAGVNAASDHLLVIVGLAPFATVSFLLWARWWDRDARGVALLALVTLATAGAVSAVTILAGHGAGLVNTDVPVRVIAPSALGHQVQLLGGITVETLGGTWAYQRASATGLAELVVGSVMCAVVVAGAVASLLLVLRSRRNSVDAQRRGRVAMLCGWSIIALSTVAAIVCTDAARDLSAVRYALPLWAALAATAPVLVSRSVTWKRVGVAVAATVLILADTRAVAAFEATPAPLQSMEAVVPLLQAHGVSHAYADYWEANSLTWFSRGAVRVRPVVQSATYCDATDPQRLCAFEFNAAAGWFAPQPGRCAVIVDPELDLRQPPSIVYGAPMAVLQAGRITVYVYDHDLTPPLDPSR